MARTKRPGAVLAIGGAEDKMRDRVILSRFLELAGGSKARIVIISTASSLGDEATSLYRALFKETGAGDVVGLRPITREEANSDQAAALVSSATAVFMTGGNQLRLSSVVAGTRLGQAVVAAHRRGAVIAGTSAGASALSSHMVAFGSSGATPKHRMVQLASGLGLIPHAIIDQHFEQRNRLGRLLAAIAQSPSLLGIGLDEDTAAVVDHSILETVGRGAVTIIDGANALSDSFVVKGHRPMMVSGVVLHTLPAGWRFDLEQRTLIPVREAEAGRAEAKAALTAHRVRTLVRQIAAEGADDRAPEQSARRSSRKDGGRKKEEASE